MTLGQQVKLWHLATQTSFCHWWARGYHYVEVPSMVRASGACEFVDSLMEASLDSSLNWAAQPVFLKQTGQLHLEGALGLFPKTFTVGRSFRGERHNPSDGRHCMEFSLHEIEFTGEQNELYGALLHEIQGFVQSLASNISANAHDLGISKTHEQKLHKWATTPFAKLTYDEAIAILQKSGEQIQWGMDFTHWQELKLADMYGPVFLTKFPDPMWDHPELEGRALRVIEFFSMFPDGKGRIDSADLILPGSGESVGAAVRLHLLDLLKERLTNSLMFEHLVSRRFEWFARAGKNVTEGEVEASVLADFAPYIEQVSSHALPHAGCGFGMNRILQSLVGKATIEEIDAFPVTFANFQHVTTVAEMEAAREGILAEA